MLCLDFYYAVARLECFFSPPAAGDKPDFSSWYLQRPFRGTRHEPFFLGTTLQPVSGNGTLLQVTDLGKTDVSQAQSGPTNVSSLITV